MMDEKINWTEDLGDAFLDQQAQVMDTVQYLRRQAYSAGNLRSSDQFRVDVRDGGFVIDFVNPEVAYLPYYNPVVVYGTWWWPTHQPVYWAPWPGYYARAGFHGYAWGPPIRVSRGFFYSAPDWRQRRVNIVNVNNYYYRAPTSRRTDAPNPVTGAPHVWQHDTARRSAEPRRDATWRQRPRTENVRVETAPRVEAAPDGRRDGRDRGAQYGNRGTPANAPATVAAPPAQARVAPTPAAPSQPVVAAPAPNTPRAAEARGRESRGNDTRANDSRGNDGRGFEQRGERTQRHDPRLDSNRVSQQPQQPAAAAPAARAPVAAATPPVASSAPPAARQPRVAPAAASAPAAPVAAGRPVEAKPAVANAPRAAEAGRGDGRQGGSHERGGRPGSNDNTVAAGGNTRQRE